MKHENEGRMRFLVMVMVMGLILFSARSKPAEGSDLGMFTGKSVSGNGAAGSISSDSVSDNHEADSSKEKPDPSKGETDSSSGQPIKPGGTDQPGSSGKDTGDSGETAENPSHQGTEESEAEAPDSGSSASQGGGGSDSGSDEQDTDESGETTTSSGEKENETDHSGGSEAGRSQPGPAHSTGGKAQTGADPSKSAAGAPQQPPTDDKKPEIRIFGVADRSDNRTTLTVSALIRDQGLKEDSVYGILAATNSGQEIAGKAVPQDAETIKLTFPEITEDDYYTLKIGGADQAGNTAEKRISFTVNQHGTVAALTNPTLNQSTVNQREVKPEFHISDVGEVTDLKAKVNGQEVAAHFNKKGNLELSRPLTREGNYTVTLEGVDSAGNAIHTTPVHFAIDRTKPRLTLSGPEEGKTTYSEPFDVVIKKDRREDQFFAIYLDGRKLSKKEYETDEYGSLHLRIDEVGTHTIRVKARDAAGNKAEESTIFTLEQKAGKDRKWQIFLGIFVPAIFLLLLFLGFKVKKQKGGT